MAYDNEPYAGAWAYTPPAAGITNSATAVTIKAAGAAGHTHFVTDLTISWATLGAAVELVINDGAAGTAIFRCTLPTVAGQLTRTFRTPLRGSAATLLEAKLSAAVTGAVHVQAQGYTQGP